MATSLKRKTSPGVGGNDEPSPKKRAEGLVSTVTASNGEGEDGALETAQPAIEETLDTPEDSDAVASEPASRFDRFKALKARNTASRTANRAETAAEAQRQSIDPDALAAVNRKRAIASHKLMRAEAAAEGEDFERKRAWDWTIEEAERWDKRVQKKDRHREDVAFQDYREEARKKYKRQMRDMKPDMEAYEKEKAEAVQRAAESGGLEIVETDDGEIVAVDKDGTFYSTANSTGFVHNRPEKAAVDRLVENLRKEEEQRMQKRRNRRGDDDADVTYINEKNKVCPLSVHLDHANSRTAIQPEACKVLQQVHDGYQRVIRAGHRYIVIFALVAF